MAPTTLLFPAVAVTGQIVVEIAITSVTTAVDPAGQSVIDAAHEVIVTSRVLYTVEVV